MADGCNIAARITKHPKVKVDKNRVPCVMTWRTMTLYSRRRKCYLNCYYIAEIQRYGAQCTQQSVHCIQTVGGTDLCKLNIDRNLEYSDGSFRVIGLRIDCAPAEKVIFYHDEITSVVGRKYIFIGSCVHSVIGFFCEIWEKISIFL